MKHKNSLLYPLALLLPILFATPFIVLLKNPDDFKLSLITYSGVLLAVTLILTVIMWLLIKILSIKFQRKAIAILLSCATVLVIQAYSVHGFFDYGQLDGHKVHWSSLGISYWVEFISFVLSIVILYKIYLKIPQQWKTIAVVLIVFSLSQTLLLLPNYINTNKQTSAPQAFDDSVFDFSSKKNIVHILADGFQADIAKQVLDENPELAQEFTGFTFFENHLGHFQGTAPTIPSIFTGKYFDLDAGFHVDKTEQDIEKHSYVNVLSDAGYRLDFAGISKIYCLDGAHTCVNKSFNDLKSRGYFEHSSTFGDFMWLTDISLFRHVPMFLKEKIYNNGLWWLSGKIARSWSPYPDPIIREWTDNMRVTTTEPKYKWHHFIGTHIPAQWSADCQFLGRQPQVRDAYKAQAHCILKDMAQLFKKMKQLNIYDNSIIIINGDHGSNIPANDLFNRTKNRSTYRDEFLGVVRPVFMFKKPMAQGSMMFSNAPTTLIDIAPTILDVAGLPTEKYSGVSAFKKIDDEKNTRYFNRYLSQTFWSGKPIMYNKYMVSGEIRNRLNWQLIDLPNRPPAPSSYDHLSYDNISQFSKGLSLSKKRAKTQKRADISGSEFSVLLGAKDSSPKELTLTLSLPDNLNHQSVNLWINQKPVVQNFEIDTESDQKISINIPIQQDFLNTGNNLFTFKFNETTELSSKIEISAKIHAISLN